MFRDIVLIALLYASSFLGAHHAFTLIEDKEPASLPKVLHLGYPGMYFGLSALLAIRATLFLVGFIDIYFGFQEELMTLIFLGTEAFAIYLLFYIANLIKPKPKNYGQS